MPVCAKIDYIDNNPSNGVEYDWKFIRKWLKKLDIPDIYYNPLSAPLSNAAWFVELSERAAGKTTGWELLGLVMYWLYGTVTIYVRSTKEQIAPKNSSTLFDVVLDNGYIEKLTGGEYNTAVYRSRKWYLAKADDSGIVHIDSKYFCRMIAIEESGIIKSSFNETKGDLILFDEFIPINPRQQRPNEFVEFVDVVSTVFRMRLCGKIVMLANTIDKYNQYFHDLEIFETVGCMDMGDRSTVVTNHGTRIFVEMVGVAAEFRKKKKRWVEMFAGFGKRELSAITGTAAWSVRNYQHIPQTESEDGEINVELIFTKLYIYNSFKYVRLDIVENADLGLCVYAHWATKTHSDSIIMTNEEMTDSRYIKGVAINTKLYRTLITLLRAGKFYFASNDVGTFVENYLIKNGVPNTHLYL